MARLFPTSLLKMERQIIEKRKTSKIYRKARDWKTKKVRYCLKCTKKFNSYNDAKICDHCREENDRIYGGGLTEDEEHDFPSDW